MVHTLTRFLVTLTLIITAGIASAQSEYRVQKGDRLIIEVLDDPSLNRTVIVLPDGRFSFPFAGALRASGRTVTQLQNRVAQAIGSNFASTPTVFVSVLPKEDPILPTQPVVEETIDVYFLGEVNTPGLREVIPGTTFLQAISQSGGLTRFAATKRIQLRRTDKRTGQQTLQSFNYKALSEGAILQRDPKLKDGDVILVPERRLFE